LPSACLRKVYPKIPLLPLISKTGIADPALNSEQALRRRAEEKLGKSKKKNAHSPKTDITAQRLVHELEARQIELEMQKVTGLRGTVQDVTKRKQAEVDLREAEARYRLLFEQSPYGILLLDLEGKTIEANRMASRQLGYTPEEFGELEISDYG